MRIVALIFALLFGCTSEPNDVDHEITNGDSTVDSDNDGQLAQQGEVCQSGEQSPEEIHRACAEGLGCCYPCGVQGCDSVCATPEECESWSTLP